jgi:hypothetical protein
VKPLPFIMLSALAVCGTGVATAQSVAAPEPRFGGTVPESAPATDATEARLVIDDAALNQDPQAGRYEVDRKIMGLRRTIDSFSRMLEVYDSLRERIKKP